MKQQPAFCKIVPDTTGRIADWVSAGLGFSKNWEDDFLTLGFELAGQLIGGLIYHNIRLGRDVWWTIYTTDKRWCSRRILKVIFALAFEVLKVKRISLLVNTDNFSCIKLVEKLGFVREGLLRGYRDDGADCYFYGMLQSENKWKGKTNE